MCVFFFFFLAGLAVRAAAPLPTKFHCVSDGKSNRSTSDFFFRWPVAHVIPSFVPSNAAARWPLYCPSRTCAFPGSPLCFNALNDAVCACRGTRTLTSSTRREGDREREDKSCSGHCFQRRRSNHSVRSCLPPLPSPLASPPSFLSPLPLPLPSLNSIRAVRAFAKLSSFDAPSNALFFCWVGFPQGFNWGDEIEPRAEEEEEEEEER